MPTGLKGFQKGHTPSNKGLKKQFCSQGHSKYSLGRDGKRNCGVCVRAANWKHVGILNENGSIFTTVDFDRAYQIQQGRCANRACNKHQSELATALHADHDHITKRFRGLLCALCNRTIGQARENKDILRGLVNYLGGLENE